MYALRYPVLIQPGTIWCPQVPVTHNISKLSRARLQAENHAEAGLAPAWGPVAQQHQDSLPCGQLGTREDYIRSGFGGGTGSTVQWQMLPWGCVTDLPAPNQTPRHEDMLQRATTRPAGATVVAPCAAVVWDCLVQFLLPSEATELLPLPFCSPLFLPTNVHQGSVPVITHFFSGKIGRSIHALAFRKEKLAFLLFSYIKHIFFTLPRYFRQLLVTKAQSIPRSNWNQWHSTEASLPPTSPRVSSSSSLQHHTQTAPAWLANHLPAALPPQLTLSFTTALPLSWLSLGISGAQNQAAPACQAQLAQAAQKAAHHRFGGLTHRPQQHLELLIDG